MLKILIQALMDVLSTEQLDTAWQQLSKTLDADASVLSNTYLTGGVRIDLLPQEIADGVIDCDAALGLLHDPAAELEISPSIAASLTSSIDSMKEDLLNAN